MLKAIVASLILLISHSLFAQAECSGKVRVVYAGNNGPSPAGNTFFVTLTDGETYTIGRVDDDLAKARYSILLLGLAGDKKVNLRFYHNDSCKEAAINKSMPTGLSVSS